jgi:hypothetical protein
MTGGAFIPEYPLVKPTKRQGARRADAVILPDEKTRRAKIADYPSLQGRSVVVVQTKASRLGMYLMGQVVFSLELCRRLGASKVKSVALCTASDDVLAPLLKAYPQVELWIWNGKTFAKA